MARAYSHHGHGPRADQKGRIHISDFRYPAKLSLAKRSRSIHVGQEQKFEETMKDYAFGSTRFDAITEN
jgi:hypothetical protein